MFFSKEILLSRIKLIARLSFFSRDKQIASRNKQVMAGKEQVICSPVQPGN